MRPDLRKKVAVIYISWPVSGIVLQLKHKLGTEGGLMQDSGLRVKTEPVRVRIFTAAFEIEGKAQVVKGTLLATSPTLLLRERHQCRLFLVHFQPVAR